MPDAHKKTTTKTTERTSGPRQLLGPAAAALKAPAAGQAGGAHSGNSARARRLIGG